MRPRNMSNEAFTAWFWDQLDRGEGEDSCWLWTGHVTPRGYGQVNVTGRLRYTHRVAYELYGAVLPDGLFVCHHCDVRNCCRPGHLFLGTAADNSRDMVEKGRSLRGERSLNAKLREADVVLVLEILGSGAPIMQSEIATAAGVSRGAISDIASGKGWRHVRRPGQPVIPSVGSAV